MTSSIGNDVHQSFAFDRADKSLGIGVQIGTVGRKSQEFDLGHSQQLLEMVGVRGISVDNQVAEVLEWTGHGVGQIARHLRRPLCE